VRSRPFLGDKLNQIKTIDKQMFIKSPELNFLAGLSTCGELQMQSFVSCFKEDLNIVRTRRLCINKIDEPKDN
jgi:hypothetical protein